VEVEEVVRVISLLDAQQTVVVDPIVGVRPTLEVWIGKFWYTPPDPHGRVDAHERASQRRAASLSALDASVSTTTACLSRKSSPRWTKPVASLGTPLYAPPHGVKSSSRAWPATRPFWRFSTSAAMASVGSRPKNSDLL
jgi:hypothetical protein